MGHLLGLAGRRFSAIRKTDPLEAHEAAIATIAAAVCAPLAGQAVLLRPRVTRERRRGFFECHHCSRKGGSNSAFHETQQACAQCSRPVKPFKLVLPAPPFPRQQQHQQQVAYEELQQQQEKEQMRRRQRGRHNIGGDSCTSSSNNSARHRGRQH
ncbi:hypothetical protein Esti_004873 [Eimeria stiedai]